MQVNQVNQNQVQIVTENQPLTSADKLIAGVLGFVASLGPCGLVAIPALKWVNGFAGANQKWFLWSLIGIPGSALAMGGNIALYAQSAQIIAPVFTAPAVVEVVEVPTPAVPAVPPAIDFTDARISSISDDPTIADRDAMQQIWEIVGQPADQASQTEQLQTVLTRRHTMFADGGWKCRGWEMTFPATCGQWVRG